MEEFKTNSTLIPAARKTGEGHIVVTLRGEIDLHNSPEVRSVILGLIQKHKPMRLIANAAEVPYMDSSAIATFVEALKNLRSYGGKLYLTSLQPRVRGLLEIAKLQNVFNLVADEAEALRP